MVNKINREFQPIINYHTLNYLNRACVIKNNNICETVTTGKNKLSTTFNIWILVCIK